MSSTVSEMIDLDYPPMIASAKGLGPILREHTTLSLPASL